MMKRLYVCILIVVGFIVSVSAETRPAARLFTTSRCFNLIASLQYFDKIKDLTQFCWIRNLKRNSVLIS